MIIAVFLFVLSLAGAGFVYLWEGVLISAQEGYRSDLNKSKNQFNPGLIEELKRANTKIDLSKELLKNHLAMSEIFDIVSKLTIESVRFKSLEVSLPVNTKDSLKLSLRGEGASFKAIAFQSDVLGQSAQYGENKLIKNPILSDLTVDANGRVAFNLTAQLSPTDISYEKVLSASLGNTVEPTEDQ
jgi:hypothetical protein